MIYYSCFLVYQIHYLSEILTSITFSQFLSYFFIITSFGTSGGLPVLSLSFNPSSPSSLYLVPFVSPCSASMQFFCYVFYVLLVFYYAPDKKYSFFYIYIFFLFVCYIY